MGIGTAAEYMDCSASSARAILDKIPPVKLDPMREKRWLKEDIDAYIHSQKRG